MEKPINATLKENKFVFYVNDDYTKDVRNLVDKVYEAISTTSLGNLMGFMQANLYKNPKNFKTDAEFHSFVDGVEFAAPVDTYVQHEEIIRAIFRIVDEELHERQDLPGHEEIKDLRYKYLNPPG